MGRTLVYPKLAYNTTHRSKDRATYDLHEIHKIINTTKVLHVSFNDPAAGPYPAILPMIGQMGSFAHPSADLDEPLECYLHGYVSVRMANLARSKEGLPVTISGTKVDSLVLSLTPFSHSYNYRSAILFGHARVVTDLEERLYAMQLITDSVMSNRWEGTRTPPDGAELGATAILRVKIEGGSGKIRIGGPNDKKEDSEADDVTSRVWAGVVPVWEVLGQPLPTKMNGVKDLPDYIDKFVREENNINEDYAKEASQTK